MQFTNADSSAILVHKALDLITTPDFPKGRAKADFLLSVGHFIRSDYDSVIFYTERGIVTLENQRQRRALQIKADLIRMLGNAYGSSGSYELSIDKFLEARIIYDEIGATSGELTSLNNIGVIFIKLERFEDALEIFLEIDSLTTDDNPNWVTIPVNLGYIYFELGQNELAKKELNRALNFPGDVDKRAYGLSNFKLGEIYRAEKNYEQSITSFNASIEIYQEFGNELEQVQSLNGLASLYLELGDLAKAAAYGETALNISEKYNALPEKKASLGTLYLISKANGDFEAALAYHERFKSSSDSLENSRVNEEIGRLTAEYQFKKRENEILLEQREHELESEATLQRQKVLLYGSIVILAFALIIIFVMYRGFLQKQVGNRALALKNQEIQSQAEALLKTNEVKDRLMSIIAHDLRGPLSSLHGIITLIEMNMASQENLEKVIPHVTKQFKHTSTLLNNLLQWAQSQMDGYKVIPESFDIIKLMQEKKSLLQSRLDEKQIELSLPEGEHTVYADRNMTDLVLQNLISNAIKYCNQGDSITASVGKRDEWSEISIRDTGIGIAPENMDKIFSSNFYTTEGTAKEKGTGLGLLLCKDFVKRNNGDIWVKSELSSGTTVTFTLPQPE